MVDRERARFSTWYELFPRSAGTTPGVHGTFDDVAERLPLIAAMGFDVLYLPPIHPIGRAQRKGRNNALTTEAGDVGSPWAIGAEEGGHKDILPAARHARGLPRAGGAWRPTTGLEIALDIAFQCAPDHPYVKAASQVVPLAPRRQRAVRREPAEEVPGHLPLQLRERGLAGAVGRAQERAGPLDRAGREASSASTTRTPSPSRSGNGPSARSSASTRA